MSCNELSWFQISNTLIFGGCKENLPKLEMDELVKWADKYAKMMRQAVISCNNICKALLICINFYDWKIQLYCSSEIHTQTKQSFQMPFGKTWEHSAFLRRCKIKIKDEGCQCLSIWYLQLYRSTKCSTEKESDSQTRRKILERHFYLICFNSLNEIDLQCKSG